MENQKPLNRLLKQSNTKLRYSSLSSSFSAAVFRDGRRNAVFLVPARVRTTPLAQAILQLNSSEDFSFYWCNSLQCFTTMTGLRICGPSRIAGLSYSLRAATAKLVTRPFSLQRKLCIGRSTTGSSTSKPPTTTYTPTNARDAVETATRVMKEQQDYAEAIRIFVLAMELKPNDDEGKGEWVDPLACGYRSRIFLFVTLLKSLAFTNVPVTL
jgi:hypothetical protein